MEPISSRAAHIDAEVIARVCQMPLVYRAAGYRAMIATVKDAGYRTGLTRLGEPQIAGYLREHPELVSAWVGYSEDQRSTPNWYLAPPKKGLDGRESWVVGFYQSRNRSPEKTFNDQFEACAFFVARKIEDFFEGWLARRRSRRAALDRLAE